MSRQDQLAGRRRRRVDGARQADVAVVEPDHLEPGGDEQVDELLRPARSSWAPSPMTSSSGWPVAVHVVLDGEAVADGRRRHAPGTLRSYVRRWRRRGSAPSIEGAVGTAAGRRRASTAAFGGARGGGRALKLWPNGRPTARFLDGDAGVQERVAAIAKEWEDVANLNLEFVRTGAAEIRISFAEKGFSWSTVGTDALTVGRDEATMNYGWLEPDTELREYQRVVRHEFGHALGMIHEHQNPTAEDPVGQAEGLRLLRPAGLDDATTSTSTSSSLRRRHDELHRVRPDVDHAVRDPRRADDRAVLGRLEHRAVAA